MELNFHLKIIQPIAIPGEHIFFIRNTAYAVIILLVIITVEHYTKKAEYKRKVAESETVVVLRKFLETKAANETKDIFIRNVSHEVRQHIGGIVGMTSHLESLENEDLIEEQKEIIGFLMGACNNLSQVTTNLLNLARLEKNHSDIPLIEPVNIRMYISTQIISQQYNASNKNIEILFSIEDDVPQMINTDPAKLSMVVMNLLSNAIKFANRDTKILVRINKQLKSWNLIIENEGEEIPKDKQKKIWDAFVTERRVTINPDGLGLGLYLVSNAVEILGGKKKVKSDEGNTAFIVTLPFDISITHKAPEPITK